MLPSNSPSAASPARKLFMGVSSTDTNGGKMSLANR